MEDKLLDELEAATLDLLAEMYSFSKPFLQGLSTKSQKFQDKFFEIIDHICEYLDTDEEQAQFQKYIEENHPMISPEIPCTHPWCISAVSMTISKS